MRIFPESDGLLRPDLPLHPRRCLFQLGPEMITKRRDMIAILRYGIRGSYTVQDVTYKALHSQYYVLEKGS